MKFTPLSLAIVASLTSVNASAILYGDDVLAEEYKDHTVRFEVTVPSGRQVTCGGLLIAGQYILTAGHCIGDYISTLDDANKRYDWFIDNGAKNEITVFQGIEVNTPNRTTLNYSVIDVDTTAADHELIDVAWREEFEFVKSQNPYFDWQRMEQELNSHKSYNQLKSFRHQDIGLIKLEKPIPQRTHAAIVAAFDPIEKTFRVSDEQRFTFKGWGRMEQFQPATTMQKTDLIWRYTGGTKEFGGDGGWVNINTYAPNFAKTWISGKPNPVSPCSANYDPFGFGCFYGRNDFFAVFPTKKSSLPESGDSGTPLLLKDNQVIALAKSTHIHLEPEFTQFTHVGHYIPLLINRIDKLAAPAMINYSFDITIDEKDAPSAELPVSLSAVGKSPVSTTFVIQNLTNDELQVNPFLQGESQYVSIAGCKDEALKPSQFCEMTIEIHGESDAVLHFGDNRNTTLPISLDINMEIIPEEKEDDSGNDDNNGNNGNSGDNDDNSGNNHPVENNSGNGGSSGGSMGLFSLLLMLVLRTIRQQR